MGSRAEALPAKIADEGHPRETSLSNGFGWTARMVVVAQGGLLGAMTVPNLLGQRPQYRLNGAARQIMGDVLAARMKAVSQHRQVPLVFPDDRQYKVCDDANGDHTVDECEGAAHVKGLRADDRDIRVVRPPVQLATRWIRVGSRASARLIAGRRVARRRASLDVPAPGGPRSKRLWTERLHNIPLTFPIYEFGLCSCGFFAHPL